MIHVTITNGDEVIADQDTTAILYSFDKGDGIIASGTQASRDGGLENLMEIMTIFTAIADSAMEAVDGLFNIPFMGKLMREAIEMKRRDEKQNSRRP